MFRFGLGRGILWIQSNVCCGIGKGMDYKFHCLEVSLVRIMLETVLEVSN